MSETTPNDPLSLRVIPNPLKNSGAPSRSHDWRGQQVRDEWGRVSVSLFVCASCGATFQPGGKSRWLERCSGERQRAY